MLNDIANDRKTPHLKMLEEEAVAMHSDVENETVIIVLDEDHRQSKDSHMVFYISTPEQDFIADKPTKQGKESEANGNKNKNGRFEPSYTNAVSKDGCLKEYIDSTKQVINEKDERLTRKGDVKTPDDAETENSNPSAHMAEKTEGLNKNIFATRNPGKRKRGRPWKHYPPENGKVLPGDKLLKSTTSALSGSCLNRRVGRPSKYVFGEDGSLTIVDYNNVKQFPVNSKAGGNSYTCDVCKMRFKTVGRLKSHRIAHSEEKPYQCGMCGKRFKRKLTLDQHALAHSGNDCYTCTVCGKVCESAARFVQHAKIHCGSDKRSCEMCDQTFNCESTMRRHMFSHAKQFKFSCGICSRVFGRPELVQSHMRVHVDDKPFACTRCPKAFKRKSDLNRHLILHSGSKPYVCGVCGTSFADQSSCHRHVREHNSLKPYNCLLCSESFKRSEALRSHVLRKHPRDDVSIYKDANNALQFIFKDAEVEARCGNTLSAESVSDVLHQVTEGEVVALVTGERPDELLNMTGDQGDQVLVQVSENLEVETSAVAGPSGDDELVTIIRLAEAETDPGNMTCTAAQMIETDDCDNALKDAAASSNSHSLDVSTNDAIPVKVHSMHALSTTNIASKCSGHKSDKFTCSNTSESAPCFRKSDTRTEVINPVLDSVSNDIVREETTMSSDIAVSDVKNDFIRNPDFQSQAYYTWLTKYTENIKSISPPVRSDLYVELTHLHKTLADALSEPKGLMGNRQNFIALLNVVKDLHGSITRHLHSVLGCLDAS